MKTVILNVVSAYSVYIQNPQTSSIQFALLNRIGDNEFKELHYPVMCREYFGDALVAAHLDQNVPPIYGFKLNDSRMVVDETLFSISIDKDNYRYFISRLCVLNRVEKKMNISLTQFFKTENNIEESKGNYKIVSVGDKKWSSSPLLISIYTLILRSFSYRTNKRTLKNHIKDLITNYNGNDVSAFQDITSKINLEHLLINIDKVLGLNPLTGINDNQLKKEVLKDSNPFYDRYTGISLDHTINSKIYICAWSISSNHSSHGILSFINNLLAVINSNTYAYVPYRNIGSQWALNYNLLLNKKRV